MRRIFFLKSTKAESLFVRKPLHVSSILFAQLATVIVAALCSCSLPGHDQLPPDAVKGVLDLRSWDFQRDGHARLNGEWEFIWQSFLDETTSLGTPGRVTHYTRVPGSWHNPNRDGFRFPVDGYGTYRLKVLLPANSPKLALLTGQMGTACALSLNGREIIRSGNPGKSRAESKPAYRPGLVHLSDAPGIWVLEMKCSNFHHALKAGFWSALEVGDSATMDHRWEYLVAVDWFGAGSLLIMAFYHLGLFSLRRRDRSALWFGFFCLLLALRSLSVGTYFWSRFLPLDWYWLAAKIDFLSIYLALPLMLLFLASIFPDEVHRVVVKLALFVGVGSAVFVAVTPQWIFTLSLTIFEIAIVLFGTYGVGALLVAAYRNRLGGRLFLFGFTIFFATTINDILSQQMLVSTGQYSAVGLFVFILSQAFLLSRRFTEAFVQVEDLSRSLEEQNVRLQAIDKIKDEFLANTSHELRTPLHGMIGLAESLVQGAAGPLPPEAHRSLGMIISSGKRLNSLVGDILDFQKLRYRDISLQIRPIDLSSLTDIVIAVSKPLTHQKPIEITNEIDADISAVAADENRLQQILHNLIGNAVKFTSEGRVTVTARAAEDMVEVSVTDTGPGIPSDKHEIIFQSFEQADTSTEREFGGTGLGLSITRHLVELHGGTISVESSPGHGARFFFTLPAAAGSPEILKMHPVSEMAMPMEVATTGGHAHNGHRAVVLVVDDEPVNRQVLSNVLAMRNFTVREAADGPLALALLEKEKPDAVLLDIMMPRMNGFEVCRAIRQRFTAAELPVVFLSARNRPDDIVTGLDAGGSDYLPKPFSVPELLARINAHIHLKEAHDQAVNLRDQLGRQEKLAAIGNMAAGIVHDLRNPLTLIRGFVEMADEDHLGKKSRQAYLSEINVAAARIGDMVQDLLDYSRGGMSVHLTSNDAASYLLRVESILRPVFDERNLTFSIQQSGAGNLQLDPDRFLRVFTNIAANAADAMQAGGSFTVRLRWEDDGAVIELEDTGQGIPDSIQSTLFEPFVTHGKNHGTGLGMAVVKSIVEAHGGRISFETSAKGTTFTIVLPP